LIAQWTPERHFEVVGATKTKSKVPRTPTAHKTPAALTTPMVTRSSSKRRPIASVENMDHSS
uniref:Uncharacterized protein n=1 Tax=Plectus sambesii TaxID=2011161 RepID=A0A914VGR5_9BILA